MLAASLRCIVCSSGSITGWRTGGVAVSEINYRRFFDINDLAGIRVEDARTFRDVHGWCCA